MGKIENGETRTKARIALQKQMLMLLMFLMNYNLYNTTINFICGKGI